MFLELSRSEKIARSKTLKSIENNIPKNLLNQQFIKDQINEYMIYYDVMRKINFEIHNSEKLENDLLKEKRQISKEMRNILDFLSIYKNKSFENFAKDEPTDEIKL